MKRLMRTLTAVPFLVILLCSLSFGEEFLMKSEEMVTGELISYDGETFRVRGKLGILSIKANDLAVIRFNTEGGVLDIALGGATPQKRDRIQGKVESFQQGELRIATDYGYLVINKVGAVRQIQLTEAGEMPKPEGQEEHVLFSDDFEVPTLAWDPVSGTWGIQGGVYTILEQNWGITAFTYVKGSAQWKDYAVECDVSQKWGSRDAAVGIVVRALDDLNKVILWLENKEKMCWRVVKEGKWSNCINWVAPGSEAGRVRVEVKGDIYTAYVDGVERTKFQDSTFPNGMVGLAIFDSRGSTFDNCKVFSLE